MAQVARVRKGALALPEVEEGTHFGMVAFAVRGKNFVSLTKDEQHVRIHLPTDVVESTVAEHAEAEPLVRMGTRGLPAIGRPAATALGLAGITSLEKVAEHTEEELFALHGVGSKAVRILREAMAVGGLEFRTR
jgi:hypothetical protein